MATKIRRVALHGTLVSVLLYCWMCVCGCQTFTYENELAVFKDRLSSDRYSTEIRPLKNQTDVVHVFAYFELISIVRVDEVSQSFHANGFAGFMWHDEIAGWDPEKYGGIKLIHPKVTQVWKPRVALLNTLEERDIFDDDDNAPMWMHSYGLVGWYPGSLFSTSCDLDLTNYPFDEQTCYIQMIAMGYEADEVQFKVDDEREVSRTFYIPNGEWEVRSTKTSTFNTSIIGADGVPSDIPTIQFSFTIKRRPTSLLLNVVLPTVFLSFLNLLVFVIPVQSGEKISYGITVLLALSVFLGIISESMPKSTDKVPAMTVYLFALLVISVLTVIDSIVIVFFHYKMEDTKTPQTSKEKFKTTLTYITRARGSAHALNAKNMGQGNQRNMYPYHDDSSDISNVQSIAESTPKHKVNIYVHLCKYIDIVSFILFFIAWFSASLGLVIFIYSG